jgi:hypothetical protein
MARTKTNGLDSFDKDLIRRKVFDAYAKKEYPTLKELKAELEFQGSISSMWRISTGFRFKASTDGRTFLMERMDIVTASHFSAKNAQH